MKEAVPVPERMWGQSLAPPRRSRLEIAVWIIAFLATAIIATGYAYHSIFSVFQGYDDEGYVLLSLKEFFQGKPLYDEVYSSFQPAFYFGHWLLFKIWGAPLCHDNIRLVTLVLWLVAAGLNGLATYRLAASSLLALLVSVISVRCFDAFANEPGHPQALAYVLVAAVLVTFSFVDSIKPRLFALTIGALVGLALLIKINVGLFLLLPNALLFGLSLRGRLGFCLKAGTGIAMIALPPLLWRAQLAGRGAPLWDLYSLEMLCLLLAAAGFIAWRGMTTLIVAAFVLCTVGHFETNSISVAAPPVFSSALLSLSICSAFMMFLGSSGSEHKEIRIAWALAAGGLVTGSILLLTLIRGTTLHGLVDGLFWWPARLSTSFLIRPRSNWAGPLLGLAGSAACFAYLRLRTQLGDRTWFRSLIMAGQLCFGLAVLAEFYLRLPGSSALMPLSNDLPHFWMLPFAWLVAVPQEGTEKLNFQRLALLLIAVMQPLIACPVAGTQLVPASILISVVGAVCLSNGSRAFLGWRHAMVSWQSWRWAAGTIGAAAFLWPFSMETLRVRQYYLARTPLDLPGAIRIRLAPEEVGRYHNIVAQLARPEVTTFLTLPGMDSFYLWAQKEPPNGLNVSAWIILLDGNAQERIWRAAEGRPGLMAVRNRRLIRSWVGGHSVAQLPLVQHIDEEFKTVSRYGDYELMAKKDSGSDR